MINVILYVIYIGLVPVLVHLTPFGYTVGENALFDITQGFVLVYRFPLFYFSFLVHTSVLHELDKVHVIV